MADITIGAKVQVVGRSTKHYMVGRTGQVLTTTEVGALVDIDGTNVYFKLHDLMVVPTIASGDTLTCYTQLRARLRIFWADSNPKPRVGMFLRVKMPEAKHIIYEITGITFSDKWEPVLSLTQKATVEVEVLA